MSYVSLYKVQLVVEGAEILARQSFPIQPVPDRCLFFLFFFFYRFAILTFQISEYFLALISNKFRFINPPGPGLVIYRAVSLSFETALKVGIGKTSKMLFALRFSRSFSCTAKIAEATSISGNYRFVHCPKPVKDTGCTYCEPDLFTKSRINHKKNLRNSTVALYKHVLLLNGSPDHESWPKRFEMNPGQPISDITMLKRKFTDGYHPSMVSMTSLQESKAVPGFDLSNSALVGLYPDGLAVEVPIDRMKDFVVAYLSGSSGSPGEKEQKEKLKSTFKSVKLTKDYILVCGHKKRDIRCGKMGPLVMAEFRKTFEMNHIQSETAALGYISHIGGHKFAANVLVFKKNGDVIWYGRVEPKHVQGIVEKTVLGNEIIEELYRG